MKVPIYREAAIIPKGSSSEPALYCYSFEPIGELGPWTWVDAPEGSRLEYGREEWEVNEDTGEPFMDDISDLRLVMPDGTRLAASTALELFGEPRGDRPELN